MAERRFRCSVIMTGALPFPLRSTFRIGTNRPRKEAGDHQRASGKGRFMDEISSLAKSLMVLDDKLASCRNAVFCQALPGFRHHRKEGRDPRQNRAGREVWRISSFRTRKR